MIKPYMIDAIRKLRTALLRDNVPGPYKLVLTNADYDRLKSEMQYSDINPPAGVLEFDGMKIELVPNGRSVSQMSIQRDEENP